MPRVQERADDAPVKPLRARAPTRADKRVEKHNRQTVCAITWRFWSAVRSQQQQQQQQGEEEEMMELEG